MTFGAAGGLRVRESRIQLEDFGKGPCYTCPTSSDLSDGFNDTVPAFGTFSC